MPNQGTFGLVAFVATSAALPIVYFFLRHKGIMDVPNERSAHDQPTPRGGGAAQLIGLLFGWGAAGWLPFWGVLCSIVLGLVGLVDDVRSQPPVVRLTIQVVIGLAMAVAIFGQGIANVLAVCVVLGASIFVVVVVNATNFMDGINGISALHGSLLGLVYAMLLAYQGSIWSSMSAILVGLSLALLPWNWGRSAKIFMGDSGSYLMGALLSLFALAAWESGVSALTSMTPLVIYLGDVLWTVIKRARRKEKLLVAHRDHTYQQLVDQGLSHARVSVIAGGFTTLACTVALTTQHRSLPLLLQLAALALILGTYLSLPNLRRFLQKA